MLRWLLEVLAEVSISVKRWRRHEESPSQAKGNQSRARRKEISPEPVGSVDRVPRSSILERRYPASSGKMQSPCSVRSFGGLLLLRFSRSAPFSRFQLPSRRGQKVENLVNFIETDRLVLSHPERLERAGLEDDRV
jgi:hypothetical protein